MTIITTMAAWEIKRGDGILTTDGGNGIITVAEVTETEPISGQRIEIKTDDGRIHVLAEGATVPVLKD